MDEHEQASREVCPHCGGNGGWRLKEHSQMPEPLGLVLVERPCVPAGTATWGSSYSWAIIEREPITDA